MKNKLNLLSVVLFLSPLMSSFNFDSSDYPIESSTVIADLNTDSSFNYDEYPVNKNDTQVHLINFAEFGYNETSSDVYQGYIYLYNPSLINFNTIYSNNSIGLKVNDSSSNKIRDFKIKFVNSADNNLFLKYKINDYDFKNLYFLESDLNLIYGKRDYEFSYLNLFDKSSNSLKAYSLSQRFIYTGYGKGMNNNDISSLALSVSQQEFIDIDVNHDVYRFEGYSSLGKGHQNDLFYCYFNINNEYSKYGDLVGLDSHYYKYQTNDLFVFKNNEARLHFVGSFDKKFFHTFYNGVLDDIDPRLDDPMFFTFTSFFSPDGVVNKNVLNTLINNTGRHDSCVLNKDPNKNYSSYSSFSNKDKLDILSYEDVYKGNGWQYFIDGLLRTNQDDSSKNLPVLAQLKLSDVVSDTDNNLKITKDSKAKLIDTLINPFSKTYILRYHVADYETAPLYVDVGGRPPVAEINGSYVARETVFLDYQIITATFEKNGVRTVLNVVSDPKDNLGGLTPPLPGTDWWKILLGIIGIIFGIVLLFVFFPTILQLIISAVVWLIKLPFKFCKWIVSLIH